MGFIDQEGIEKRLAPLKEQFGENSDELWAEKLKIEREYGMMLFKRPIEVCAGVLHVVDDRRHEAGEKFTVVAKSKCPFSAEDAFLVPEEFQDLVVHEVMVGKKSQRPESERLIPLRAFKRQSLGSGWAFNTIDGRRDEHLSMVLESVDRPVDGVRFSILGRAMPLDVYDKEKFWVVTKPKTPYDVTQS